MTQDELWLNKYQEVVGLLRPIRGIRVNMMMKREVFELVEA